MLSSIFSILRSTNSYEKLPLFFKNEKKQENISTPVSLSVFVNSDKVRDQLKEIVKNLDLEGFEKFLKKNIKDELDVEVHAKGNPPSRKSRGMGLETCETAYIIFQCQVAINPDEKCEILLISKEEFYKKINNLKGYCYITHIPQ